MEAPKPNTAVGDLQNAAAYRSAQNSLSFWWGTSMLWGGIEVLLGCCFFGTVLFTTHLLFGSCILAAGAIAFFIASPWAMIPAMLCLLVVGVLNAVPSFHDGPGIVVFLGAVQAIVGCRALWTCLARSHHLRHTPNEMAVQQLDGMIAEILQSQSAKQADMLEFTTKTLLGKTKSTWKGKLLPHGALFAEQGGEIVFCDRPALTIDDKGRAFLSGMHTARFRLGSHSCTGQIAPEYLRRFAGWQSGLEIPPDLPAEPCGTVPAIAWDELDGSFDVGRLTRWGWLALALSLGVGFMLTGAIWSNTGGALGDTPGRLMGWIFGAVSIPTFFFLALVLQMLGFGLIRRRSHEKGDSNTSDRTRSSPSDQIA